MQARTASDMRCPPSARKALVSSQHAARRCDAGAGLDVRVCAQAVMTFDLGCPAGDAAWAPYSATVFAVAGEDGKVRPALPPPCLDHLHSPLLACLSCRALAEQPCICGMRPARLVPGSAGGRLRRAGRHCAPHAPPGVIRVPARALCSKVH
jgi:hypothetical protein